MLCLTSTVLARVSSILGLTSTVLAWANRPCHQIWPRYVCALLPDGTLQTTRLMITSVTPVGLFSSISLAAKGQTVQIPCTAPVVIRRLSNPVSLTLKKKKKPAPFTFKNSRRELTVALQNWSQVYSKMAAYGQSSLMVKWIFMWICFIFHILFV